MQIESLKMYCDLAETESFTKTAQINGVTQSAISQQLSSLERQFQSLLVERSKKNFRLTREGQVLYDYSRQIIAMQKALHDRLLALKDVVSGSIRVASIYSIGLHDLPLYIKRFLKSYPTVNVHVEYLRTDQIYEDVTSNIVDVGLVAYPRKDDKLETVALRKDPMVLICHPEHPFAKRKSIELKALGGQKFVSFEPEMPTRRALDKAFRARGVAVQHMMEFDNIETVKRAVEIGAGIAVVPQMTVSEEVSSGTLAAVPIAGGGLSRPLAAIYKKTRVLSHAMKQLLALLKEEL
jgi:LysR family transcriptional regulator, transcriptional activator of the cysJI operon